MTRYILIRVRPLLAFCLTAPIHTCTSERYVPFEELAEEFATAAFQRDSTAMMSMAAAPAAVHRMSEFVRMDSAFVRAAGQDLHAEIGEIRGDTAIVDSVAAQSPHERTLGVRFVRQRDRWLIDGVQMVSNSDVTD